MQLASCGLHFLRPQKIGSDSDSDQEKGWIDALCKLLASNSILNHPAECNQTVTKHVFHVTDHQFTWAFVTRYHGYKCPMSCEADSSCHPWDSPLAQIS